MMSYFYQQALWNSNNKGGLMTSKTKTKNVYEDLREHYLADGLYILPQRKEVMQIIELMFTPEEAELALAIPVIGQGRINLEALAENHVVKNFISVVE